MKKANEGGKIGRKLSDHKLNRRSDAEWLHLKPLGGGEERAVGPFAGPFAGFLAALCRAITSLLRPPPPDPDSSAVSCDNGHNDTQLSELRPPDSPTHKTPLAPANVLQEHQSPGKENGGKAKHRGGHSHGHGHSHGGNCHSDQEMKDAGIASIAWMVIMGDGMHNFSDGLAIGGRFYRSRFQCLRRLFMLS